MRVHYFYLKVINKALYGQNHCLLPRENSQNQSQREREWTAQKSSKGTGKCRHDSGVCSTKTGKVQFLQMPVSSRICTACLLAYYCKFLRCDRSLLTVDGYRVGNCKSQGITRLSSARPSSLASDDRPMFEIKESCFFYSIANYSQSWEAE